MEKLTIIPTRERIAAEIKESILEGDLPPGTELIQEKIAEILGVSRMPVREAFLILERDGFVTIEKGRKYRVSKLTLDDIHEHYEIRAILEGNTAFKAALTKPNLDYMYELLDEMDKSKNAKSFAVYNERFHNEIWRLASAPKHSEVIELLWNRIPHIVVAENVDHRTKANQEHRQIAQAIKEGNAHLARDKMQQHIYRSMTDYVDRVDRLKKSDLE